MEIETWKFRHQPIARSGMYRAPHQTLEYSSANVRRKTVQKLWTIFFSCGSCEKNSPILRRESQPAQFSES
jgi:hypothetical protein